jgi:two-component system, OmpR family, phosphate regulon sensor histidine kinase PhoR
VQNALLDTLAGIPEADVNAFLDRWRSEQPLVQAVFLAGLDGALLRPNGGALSEEERGFVRRFASRFRSDAPWKRSADPAEERALEQKGLALKDQTLNRLDVAEQARNYAYQNTQRLQRSREEVQKVAKKKVPTESSALSDYSIEPQRAAAPALRAEAEPVGRRGWAAQVVDGRTHLLGWIEVGSQVRGLELDMADLGGRLAGALPEELSGWEGLALKDDKGRIWHQTGWIPRETGTPLFAVPLDVSALPGWSVAGYLQVAPYGSSSGGTMMVIASGVMAVMILAILTGGSLLLWHARRSETEAQLKTSFVANVSHEFKTPLTTIRLYSELLEQGRVSNEEKRSEYLRTIGRETQRLARLVNNALDFSRLEQGRKKFQLERIEVKSFVEPVLEVLRPRLLDSGMSLRVELPSTEVEATADRDALEQILLNVVDNACKYAANGRELAVSVEVRAEGSGASGAPATRTHIAVSDRGPGVPTAHRERIFEKFHRVDETLTAEKTGAGLGLSIARQLARGMGGDLTHAPREGGGSVFVIKLP